MNTRKNIFESVHSSISSEHFQIEKSLKRDGYQVHSLFEVFFSA